MVAWNGLSWIPTFPRSSVVVTDRERQLSQDFWARRGQGAPSSQQRRGRIRMQPRERIFVALGIAVAVAVVVMGMLR